MEIIHKLWPGDNPFIHDRHAILKAVKNEFGPAGRGLNFNAYSDKRSIVPLRHAYATERDFRVPTLAAWNDAIYVAQNPGLPSLQKL